MARPKKIDKATTGNPVVDITQPAVVAVEQPATEDYSFSVSDPLVLRPKELELVIKAPAGGWVNDAQAEFATTLNGYAYKNPDKWQEKKDALLKQLNDLGKNPKLIIKLRGNDTNISYGNELMKGIIK